MTRFEFDPVKNALNLERHGVDFIRAQELWEGPHAVIPAKAVSGENRSLILGTIGGRVYAAVFTRRGEAVRLISCHRADGRLTRVFKEHVHEEP